MINYKAKKIVFLLAVIGIYLINAGNTINDEVFRFHVLANSDTKEDQEIKLKVKSVVADAVSADLEAAGVHSKKSAMEYIRENRNKYVNMAEKTIKENGYSYGVSATVGIQWFPVKVYGNEVYPEGEYDAFRIIIGEGKGKNWWCVLYPSLCKIDETCYVRENTEDNHAPDNEEEYEFRFRFIEWLCDMW